jgi:hypothetical protein
MRIFPSETAMKQTENRLYKIYPGANTVFTPTRRRSATTRKRPRKHGSKTFEFFHAGFAQLTGSAKDAPVRVNTEILQFPFFSIAAAASRPSAC